MQRIIMLLSIVMVVVYTGCKKSDNNPSPQSPQVNCDNVDSRFSARVFPLIQNSCATNIGCHANGSANGPGALTSFAQISNASGAIRNAVISGAMPRGSTLSTDEKNIIICWVNSGTPNN